MKIRRRAIWIVGAGALVIVLACAGLAFVLINQEQQQEVAQKAAAQKATPVAGVTHVEMKSYNFTPANITIHVGTAITWTNEDNAPHSVTFNNGMKDSGLFNQGGSFSYTFTTPGTYHYYCTQHPYMVGSVIVTS